MSTTAEIITIEKTLTDGRVVNVAVGDAEHFRGLDAEGDQMVETDIYPAGDPRNWLVILTPCCNASGKGLSDEDYGYVGCRHCYAEVDPKHGGVFTLADVVVPVAA